MSLLLDALKRAEDAKRAKAEAAATASSAPPQANVDAEPSNVSHDESDHPPLTLEAHGDHDARPRTSTPSPMAAPSTPSSPLSSATGSEPTVLALSLEDIDTPPQSPAAPPITTTTVSSAALEAILSADDSSTSSALAATPRATAAFRAARMQARDAPLMSDPAASAAGREVKATAVGAETIDADAGTPVSVSPQPDAVLTQQRDAVKNAFAVKQSAKPTKRNAIALGIVAVLLLLTSAGGWYVWTEMNRLARPQAAKPSPPTVLAAASAPATAPTATAPQSAGGAPVTPNSATGATTGAPSVDSAGFDATLSPASVPTAALPPLLPPPAIEIATPKALAASKAAAPTPREAVARQAEALPAALAPAQKVQLKPATGSALIDPALAAGYAALTAGDYASAKRHYADVLAASTNNIDAHLGMATALARSTTAEDTRSAKRYYARVLELDPRNGTAMAGLIALSSDMRADTMTAPADRARFEQREAELSRLVTADPQSATAHYMLGNHYAAARRWTEAQSSYFEAARLAPDNADFAYNLAVSLDHLGQARNALLFYQRALAARTRGTFDRKVVEARVSAISAQPLDAAAPARGVQ